MAGFVRFVFVLHALACGSLADTSAEVKLSRQAAPQQSLARPAPTSLLATDGTPVPRNTGVKFSAAVAEFIAMTLFVVIGCGSAMGIAKEEGSAWVFQVSLTFGLAIASLAYAVGHYSGGQINCAVTLGLVLSGQCTIAQGVVNFIAQMLGSVTGALLLAVMYPEKNDRTGGLATNAVGEGWGKLNALAGEFVMTFVLVFVVLETATNPASLANRAQAPLAIGFAVFLAHSVLIPVDGCSINPTRSFGPAVVAQLVRGNAGKALSDMWIFWVGPLLGAAAAAGVSAALMW